VADENGEHVFVTSIVQPIDEPTLQRIEQLRTFRMLDPEGNEVKRTAMLAFDTAPNPDAEDGTEVGTFLDVSRP
jgi:hypothetical protein